MKTCNTGHQALVLDLLRSLLGTLSIELRPIPTYPDSIVYAARADGRAWVFKAHDPAGEDPDGICLEAWTCEKAASVGVPAPHVLVLDTSRSVFPGSYFVMERASGVPLNELADPQLLDRQVGEFLRLLHDVRLPGSGFLDEGAYLENGVVRGSHGDWRSWLVADMAPALDYLEKEALSGDEASLVREAAQTLMVRAIPDPHGCLVHGDLGRSHVYVHAGRVTSFIDFGQRAVADWAWDFIEYDARGLGSVMEGYGLGTDQAKEVLERVHVYRFLKAIPWAWHWHRRGEKQVTEWLLRTLRGLP